MDLHQAVPGSFNCKTTVMLVSVVDALVIVIVGGVKSSIFKSPAAAL
jgi:hypothetical protein